MKEQVKVKQVDRDQWVKVLIIKHDDLSLFDSWNLHDGR